MSSVLPTPVGPRNMNEPIGRFGSCSPARARRTALDDGLHGLALADDALAELVFHAQQLVALAFQHLVDRNAGPARHDVRDVVGRHGLLDHAALAVLRLGLLELLLQLGDRAIGQLAGLLELALALRDGEFVAGLVELLLEVGGEAELLLLGLPLGGDRGGLLLEAGELLLEPRRAGPSTRRPSRPSAPRARS